MANSEKEIIEEIIRALMEFYTPDAAVDFLYSRQRLLHNRAPIECIHAGNADDVRAIIDQLRSGACV